MNDDQLSQCPIYTTPGWILMSVPKLIPHLITVDHQKVEEPQRSQADVFPTETCWTDIFLSPRVFSLNRGALCFIVRAWSGRLRSIKELRQVNIQQREEEGSSRAWPRDQIREEKTIYCKYNIFIYLQTEMYWTFGILHPQHKSTKQIITRDDNKNILMCSYRHWLTWRRTVLLWHSLTTRWCFCSNNGCTSNLWTFVHFRSCSHVINKPFVVGAGWSIWLAQAHHVQSSNSQTLERTQGGSTITTTDFRIGVEPKTCWFPAGEKKETKISRKKNNHPAAPCFAYSSCYISWNILISCSLSLAQ